MDTSVKMDAKTKKTYSGAVGRKTNQQDNSSTGGSGILGTEFEQKYSIEVDE